MSGKIVDEQGWESSTSPWEMMESCRNRVSDRKLLLFMAARARQQWDLLKNDRYKRAVDLAERFADGKASIEELEQGKQGIWGISVQEFRQRTPEEMRASPSRLCAFWRSGKGAASDVTCCLKGSAEARVQIDILRCLFGNPFRPVAFEAAWRTPTVRSLAEAAYQERSLPRGTLDSDRLAVLADALEDAGCDSNQMLDHLRGPGPHMRGCWALDLILGKQ